MEKKYGMLSSSEDPQKLSDTVRGGIIALSVVIIYAAKLLGVEIGGEQVVNFAIGAGTAVSSIWIVYGLVKKFVIFIQEEIQKRK